MTDRVFLRDFKDTGFCVAGQRDFCARHGIDFRDYARNGVPAETLLATGDDMAARMVERARRNREAERGK